MSLLWLQLLALLEYAILALLLGLSVWSVAIMVDRRRYFAALLASPTPAALSEALRLRDAAALRQACASAQDPYAGLIREALAAGGPESVDRAVRAYLVEERTRMEQGLTVLATLGSNAPFIGLLGTVLGIIQAFGVLADNQSGMAVVMASLAKALGATAVGLFVAIPAVAAYNLFSKRMRLVLTQAESLRDRFIAAFPGGTAAEGS
jgi:biopolymer transport protein ExbB